MNQTIRESRWFYIEMNALLVDCYVVNILYINNNQSLTKYIEYWVFFFPFYVVSTSEIELSLDNERSQLFTYVCSECFYKLILNVKNGHPFVY